MVRQCNMSLQTSLQIMEQQTKTFTLKLLKICAYVYKTYNNNKVRMPLSKANNMVADQKQQK